MLHPEYRLPQKVPPPAGRGRLLGPAAKRRALQKCHLLPRRAVHHAPLWHTQHPPLERRCLRHRLPGHAAGLRRRCLRRAESSLQLRRQDRLELGQPGPQRLVRLAPTAEQQVFAS
jgi:hypothetical protein